MATTDYLRFSANSIKQLIKNKLNEDGTFSDQAFEDSNLSTMIDLFSYMFSVLMFYLNTSATESIFTDAQLYENINRIVKMLGYNPIGFIPSTVPTIVSLKTSQSFSSSGQKTIPKYSTYTTNLVDSNGNPIRYTFIKDFVINAKTTNSIETDSNPILYNGTWKLYDTVFTSTGVPFETFTLDNLNLEVGDENRIYISHKHIDVIVEHADGTFSQWNSSTNLYNSSAKDENFELRLNENYKYTLKFGDNINGKKLTEEDKIYVIYLKTNGPDGKIGSNVIDGTANLEVRIDGLTELFIKDNILEVNGDGQDYITFGIGTVGYDTPVSSTELRKIKLVNNVASSLIAEIEGVDEIRENASNWFRMGSRLITNQDFRQYILATYSTDVYDVKIMNNWEYMTSFQKWLQDYGKLSVDIRFFDYAFSDSCDFNNIYIWLKGYNKTDPLSVDRKREIEVDVNRLKCLTSEVSFFDPLLVNLTPWLGGNYNIFNWDPNNENKIELIRDRNTFITVERIKQRALNVIRNFFSLENNKLGQSININNLYSSLMAIDGVKEVRTSYLPNGAPSSQTQYFDGLSFGIWTPHILKGADIQKISGSYKIKDFQFPNLLDSNALGNRVSVIADSFSIPEVEY